LGTTGSSLERQPDLLNLAYTNGTHWRLCPDGELVAGPVILVGWDMATAGRELTASAGLEHLRTDFLRWKPQPIKTAGTPVSGPDVA